MKKNNHNNHNELPLSRKYRPESFDEMFGNIDELKSLKITVQEKKVTTFLLYGDRGCGKSTASRIIAKELGAGIGLKEMNISNTTGIDSARKMIDDCRYCAPDGKPTVIVLNEIQGASKAFQQSILEILEEPPKDTYFILCTTNPEKLSKPVKSRCSQFRFSPLSLIIGRKFIKDILGKENQELSKEVINGVLKATDCIPREILTLLDKIFKIDEAKRGKLIQNYVTSDISEEVNILCQLLLKKENWKVIAKVVQNIKEDPETIRMKILGYMGIVLLRSGKRQAAVILECFKDNFFETRKSGLILACYSSIC